MLQRNIERDHDENPREITIPLQEEGNSDQEEYSSQDMIRDARHRREHGDRELTCNNCDHKFRSATLLQRHIETCHVEIHLAEVTIPLRRPPPSPRSGRASRRD